jgi:hypothetical protein
MEGYGGSGEIGDGATYGAEREELEFGGAFGRLEMECEEERRFGEVDGRFKGEVEMRSPWIWVGEMRSGSWLSSSILLGDLSPFSFGVELSVSVSSSAPSWISPRPMTPMVSEDREKGGGTTGDKMLDGDVGMRIGSIDRNDDGKAGVWLSESLIGLVQNPVPKRCSLSPTVGWRKWVVGRVIIGEGGVSALECLRSKTGESMTASQSSQWPRAERP